MLLSQVHGELKAKREGKHSVRANALSEAPALRRFHFA